MHMRAKTISTTKDDYCDYFNMHDFTDRPSSGSLTAAVAALKMPPKKGKKKGAAKAGGSGGAKAKKYTNPQIAKGVSRFSRSAVNKFRGAYQVKAKNGGKFPSPASPKKAPEPVVEQAGKFYSTEVTTRPMKSSKHKKNPQKVKAGCTPVRELASFRSPTMACLAPLAVAWPACRRHAAVCIRVWRPQRISPL